MFTRHFLSNALFFFFFFPFFSFFFFFFLFSSSCLLLLLLVFFLSSSCLLLLVFFLSSSCLLLLLLLLLLPLLLLLLLLLLYSSFVCYSSKLFCFLFFHQVIPDLHCTALVIGNKKKKHQKYQKRGPVVEGVGIYGLWSYYLVQVWPL